MQFAYTNDGQSQRGLTTRLKLRSLNPEERAKELESHCGASGDMEISKAEARNLQDPTANFHLDCEGTHTSANFRRDLGRYSYGILGPWVVEVPRFPSPTRRQNVVFNYPIFEALRMDVQSPPGFVAVDVKAPPIVESEFGRYALLIAKTPEGYHVERLYALSAVVVPAKDYDALRNFLERVAQADTTRLQFTRSETP